jgi:hypothetical protein
METCPLILVRIWSSDYFVESMNVMMLTFTHPRPAEKASDSTKSFPMVLCGCYDGGDEIFVGLESVQTIFCDFSYERLRLSLSFLSPQSAIQVPASNRPRGCVWPPRSSPSYWPQASY